MQRRQNCSSCYFVLAVFATLSTMPGSAYGQATHAPLDVLVRQVDHVILNSDEPEQLFRLFAEKLGLPIVFPLQLHEPGPQSTGHTAYYSGGVSFGNLVVEVIRLQGSHSGLVGVGLEPGASVSEIVAGLDARSLPHRAPAPFYRKDSSDKESLAYTSLSMPGLLPASIFFTEYNPAFLREVSGGDLGEIRARVQRELQDHGGGPLGIESAMELVVGVRDIAAGQRDLGILLGPPQAGREFVWQLGSGPAVRLVATQEDHLLLRVKVKSLERAHAFLSREKLLGLDTGHELSVERSRVGAADIRLVE
jgi:hypothetical protein